jgi:multidrug efflux system membrane fusion protein
MGVIALSLVLTGFWYATHHKASTDHAISAAPVRVARVERRDMPVVEHTLGTVIANATVQVVARVQGKLESAGFTEGQFVKQGDLLFQIDPQPFQAALDQARAVLLRDQALLQNARRDDKRYATLYQQHTISAQLYDTSTTNVDVLVATVAADKAAVDSARINLGYTTIRSPINGKTGPILVQPGNMVASASSTALVTITQLQPVKLAFHLPQSDLPRIQDRLKSHAIMATIDLHSDRGPGLSAPVDFTDNAINSQSGTIELRANFANAQLRLLPGQLVNVTVTLDDIPHALVVPHDALNDGPSGTYVYVVVDRHAVQRDVKVLFDDSQKVAISGDLKAGDAVIVEGQLRVVPGGVVKVFAPTTATPRQGAPLAGTPGSP